MAYKNKADQALAAKRHYDKNKIVMKARAVEFKEKRRLELQAKVTKLKDMPCMDCRIKYPHYVMEYDHVRGEKFCQISDMVNGTYSLARIEEEIDKCDLVCANCHRERTFSRKRTNP